MLYVVHVSPSEYYLYLNQVSVELVERSRYGVLNFSVAGEIINVDDAILNPELGCHNGKLGCLRAFDVLPARRMQRGYIVL